MAAEFGEKPRFDGQQAIAQAFCQEVRTFQGDNPQGDKRVVAVLKSRFIHRSLMVLSLSLGEI